MSESKYNEEFRLIYNSGSFFTYGNIYVARVDLEEIGLIPVNNSSPKKKVVFRFVSVVNKKEVHSIYIDDIVNEELDQKQTESLLRKLHVGIFKMYDITFSDLERLVKDVYEGVMRK